MQVEGYLDGSNWFDNCKNWHVKEPCGRACDFMARYEEDLDRVVDMGLNSFRYSLEWSRIEPEPGSFDPGQLAYYQRLTAACKSRGLEPIVTLWHFSYPRWIDRELRGGWANPGIVEVFGRYARVAGDTLPEVKWWLTQNEPNAFVVNTYLLGAFPPATYPFGLVGQYDSVLNNIVAAHQAAYQELKLGHPARMVSANAFHFQPRKGTWPSSPNFVARLDFMDYVAFDYYFAHQPWEWPKLAYQWRWPVHPPGLADAVLTYWNRFRLPIMIAENGFCVLGKRPRADGWTRERYLVAHIRELERAVSLGADVIGYLHWSLLDNWEMGSFEPRFGLYNIDWKDPALPRVATPAVDVYRQIAASGCVTAELGERFGM